MHSARGQVRIEDASGFDTVIDVRSPAEFAEDHLPGAINCPVLDDAQRAQIGTLYKQVSPFEARKLGGAWVAENIARHLQTRFLDRPRTWRPLIYCWRGGQRSGAFTTWFRMVGWDATQLTGGYKAYRHHVVERLAQLPDVLDMRVICGATGSAKTRLLTALAAQGAQVLDLEGLARHKGSVLGSLPGTPQPSQKAFESALCVALSGFDPARPVFVEAESRKIGMLHVPESLILRMRASPCIELRATREARLRYLLEDYAYLGDDAAALQQKLDGLRGLQSKDTLARWQAYAAAGRLSDLFAELIDMHYDPLYHRSQHGNYRCFPDAHRIEADALDPVSLGNLASALLAALTSPAR